MARAERSAHAQRLDRVQAALAPLLADRGYKKRGRTYNRLTPDGLVHVAHFQMGAFDPPGTTYIPGLRENLYGLFTINLGVYVPEVARHFGGGEARSWVQDYHCCIRARLGDFDPRRQDLWWPVSDSPNLMGELRDRLERHGFPFLEHYESREAILQAWPDLEARGAGAPMRIVAAIILVGRGQMDEARRLLREQAHNTRNPGHPAFVRGLAARLGVGDLDG